MKFLLGPILSVAVGCIFYAQGESAIMSKTSAVLVLMAYWWMTESINVYITSLLPVILFPLLGILGIETVAPQYMQSVMFLYIGGFVLTFAIERWDLHKRISLKIILKSGSSPLKMLIGFSVATYFISMWLNNTSTTLMMLPVALAIIKQIHGNDQDKTSGLATAILLCISFASSIGGTSSLVGTLPNMVMKNFYDENFPNETALTFSNWIVVALPMSIALLCIMIFILNKLFLKNSDHIPPDLHYCNEAYKKLGKFSFEEKIISVVFLLAILLWLTLDDKEFGNFTMYGWETILIKNGIIPNGTFVNESYVSIFMAAILLFFPSKNKKGTAIVTWNEMKHMPIGILFLFGGGFALSEGVKISGLNIWIGEHLLFIQHLPLWLMIFTICCIVTLFSEFASNTATVILFMTIITPVVQQLGLPPALILFPVAIAASFSFMLPAGTPPNTIVFGTEKLKVKDMMRAGIYLDIAGAIIITLVILTIGKSIFT